MVKKIDTFFVQILEYLVCDRKSLHELLLVSKKFYLGCTSDSLWSRIDLQSFEIVFEGFGSEGKESNEWSTCRYEAGLPIFNIMKLQWLAHNASRLKIYYGTLKRQSTQSWASFFTCMSDSSEMTSSQGERILLVGHDPRLLSDSTPRPSAVFLQQLMYLIPTSATRQHRSSSHCRCILPGYTLKEIEPFPAGCRSHRPGGGGGVDSGIRVESHPQYPALTYRRVGDDRLSFLQFDYSDGQFSYKRDQYRELLQELFQKCVGTVIVLDYQRIKEPSDLSAIFRSLYSLVTHRLWVKSRSDSSVLQSMSIEGSHKAVQRSCSTQSPLLVVVAIPQRVIESEGTAHSKAVVQHIVEQVGRVVEDVLTEDRGKGEVKRGTQSSRLWYVQPINQSSELGDLAQGVFAGVNWLIRSMMKSKQT